MEEDEKNGRMGKGEEIKEDGRMEKWKRMEKWGDGRQCRNKKGNVGCCSMTKKLY